MKNALAAILIMLPLLLSQPSTGCTVAGSDLAASVANATACLEIPAGTYDLSGSSGVLLSSSAANLDIAGAGMRQTIIRVTGAMTLTSDLIVLRLLGTGQ